MADFLGANGRRDPRSGGFYVPRDARAAALLDVFLGLLAFAGPAGLAADGVRSIAHRAPRAVHEAVVDDGGCGRAGDADPLRSGGRRPPIHTVEEGVLLGVHDGIVSALSQERVQRVVVERDVVRLQPRKEVRSLSPSTLLGASQYALTRR